MSNRREIDTLGMTGVEEVHLNLFYPRVEGNPDSIKIALFDVRAANDITIKFDFDRNGWVIYSDMLDPDLHEDQTENELQEVAFVTAWPGAKE